MEFEMAVDATSAALAAEIGLAREALIRKSRENPAHWWPAWKIRAEVKNGWRDGATSLALNQLLDDGTFEVEGDTVRISG
jgi:hypothetical protein